MAARVLLGAHVSMAGGVSRAPARGAQLGATAIQCFTKPVNRWMEPSLSRAECATFRREREAAGIAVAGSHDSYLINLASPDRRLLRRSLASFKKELARAAALGLDFVVTHPGNATDEDRDRGLAQNAAAIGEALVAVPASFRLLLECAAGQGTALGSTFEELASLLRQIPPAVRPRVGVCLDTAHLLAAGYDLVNRYEEVFEAFDRVVGLERLGLLHLNDSKAPLGSRVDRHQHIGKGALGDAPFRRIMNDPRFTSIPKLIETPKEANTVWWDRRNLRRLRSFVVEQAQAGVGAADKVVKNELERTLDLGIERFDRGAYFEAHEAWEEAWRRTSGQDAAFFHGLVQAAAACLHATRGNRHGAVTLLRKARQHLDCLPSPYRGIDLAQLGREVEDYISGARGPAARRPRIGRVGGIPEP
ncbi:MAG: deoxyribonuclease IV [Gemmatimonadetes bacterium]|nr:deoxyribonuclease IV [Gemmatimonadota bacterium]